MANIREIALNIIIEYYRDGTRKPSLLKDSLEKYDYLETRDKAFIKRLVDGCLERQIQIDYVIDSFAKTKVKDMQPFIRGLMRMSTYQILFMDQVPDSAACNEAVKLAKKHRFGNLSGFVNGVLRNVSRNKDSIKYPDRSEDGGVFYLSVYYSTPEWICRMWLERFGIEKTEGILDFFLRPRPVTVRVTSRNEKEIGNLQNNVSALKKELVDAGCRVTENPILPYALDLENTDNIAFLPGYSDGRFAVQDVSSMLVTEIAQPSASDVVIDVCAAPGGKSLHASERAMKVIARDVSERKCNLISENADRLRVDNITVDVHDARIHDEKLEGMADILYLDVPCSGLGIIGRKSDIKYNVSEKSSEEIKKLQWEIVKSSWDYVRVGGTLIYSTCTVNRGENEDMVERILSELPFEVLDISGRLTERLKSSGGAELEATSRRGYIQLVPGEHGTDGFFIAALRRKES